MSLATLPRLSAQAEEDLPPDDVSAFVDRMQELHGFEPDRLHAMFSRLKVSDRVISLMDAPLGSKSKAYWREYQRRRLSPEYVAAGAKFMKSHAGALARAQDQYGVPPEIITAILGVETRYGRILGDFEVIRALATLAFAYPRRAEEFLVELEEFLLYARQTGLDPLRLKGSFAGAFGMPQFLPGSARRYAVDFDENGRIDLFAPADAAGSIANFLAAHGWREDGPVLYPARPGRNPAPLLEAARENDYKPLFTRAELAEAGVSFAEDVADGLYLLVDLESRYDTEYRLGAQNFYALTRYNKSFKYAAAVHDLGAAIRARA